MERHFFDFNTFSFVHTDNFLVTIFLAFAKWLVKVLLCY